MTTIFSSAPKKQRLPRVREEGTELPGFRLTPRDKEILLALADYRALTTHQVDALIFNPESFEEKLVQGAAKQSAPSRCSYRLQKLYHHGYVKREEIPQRLSEGRKPFIYFLDTKGLNYLTYHELIEDDSIYLNDKIYSVRYPFLQHLLDINTFRICVTLAARREGWTISRWIDEKTLKQAQNVDVVTIKSAEGKNSKASLVPDAFFHPRKGGNNLKLLFGTGSLDRDRGVFHLW